MDVQKIKYNHELFKNKIRLENETIMMNREIKKQQLKCNHIRICLGWDDGASSYFNTGFNVCLFCHKNDPESRYETVYASDYKKELYHYGEVEGDREDCLKELQDLALNIITENSGITESELVEKLANIISETEKKPKQIKFE